MGISNTAFRESVLHTFSESPLHARTTGPGIDNGGLRIGQLFVASYRSPLGENASGAGYDAAKRYARLSVSRLRYDDEVLTCSGYQTVDWDAWANQFRDPSYTGDLSAWGDPDNYDTRTLVSQTNTEIVHEWNAAGTVWRETASISQEQTIESMAGGQYPSPVSNYNETLFPTDATAVIAKLCCFAGNDYWGIPQFTYEDCDPVLSLWSEATYAASADDGTTCASLQRLVPEITWGTTLENKVGTSTPLRGAGCMVNATTRVWDPDATSERETYCYVDVNVPTDGYTNVCSDACGAAFTQVGGYAETLESCNPDTIGDPTMNGYTGAEWIGVPITEFGFYVTRFSCGYMQGWNPRLAAYLGISTSIPPWNGIHTCVP